MRLLRFYWLVVAIGVCSAFQIGCSDGCSEEKQQEESKKEAQQPEKMAQPSSENTDEQADPAVGKKSVRQRRLQEVVQNDDPNAAPTNDEINVPPKDRNVPEARRTGRGPGNLGSDRDAINRTNAPTESDGTEVRDIGRGDHAIAAPADPEARTPTTPVPSVGAEPSSVDLAAQQALLAEAAGGKTPGEGPVVPASRAERLAALQKDLNNASPRRPEPDIVDVPGPEVVEPVTTTRTVPSVDRAQRLREHAAQESGNSENQPSHSARTFQPSVPDGPPIPIDHALALSELQSISGKQFKISSLSGQKSGPSYNSLYFSPKIGQDFGVAVQLWHESSIRDTRTRYEQMKASYPNVQETGNITTYTYFAHWKEIYYLVFMDLKKRRVVCVSGSNKALSPNQLFTIATKIRDRLI
ncbi:MAG: hypothetical protein HUU55_20365 [Myxococcales bacterium]|nr:hypothetical protein [Myxococcales bacterium]